MKKPGWRRAFEKADPSSRPGDGPLPGGGRRATSLRPVASDDGHAGRAAQEGAGDADNGRAPAGEPAAAPPSAEVMVLRAGLEDCLCHLVELYGPDVLDSFLERRLRRNIAPILAHAAEMESGAQGARIRAHATAAERLLRDAVESVRKDPTPPSG